MLSPGHNQNWIYDDVTQILNMAPKPRDTIQGHFSALSYPLEMTFSHSTLGAAPLNNEEAHECEKMATDEVRVFSRAIPIKCFVSHRPPSREGGWVGRANKKKGWTHEEVWVPVKAGLLSTKAWLRGPFVCNSFNICNGRQ